MRNSRSIDVLEERNARKEAFLAASPVARKDRATFSNGFREERVDGGTPSLEGERVGKNRDPLVSSRAMPEENPAKKISISRSCARASISCICPWSIGTP